MGASKVWEEGGGQEASLQGPSATIPLQWRNAVKDALSGPRVPGDLRISEDFLGFLWFSYTGGCPIEVPFRECVATCRHTPQTGSGGDFNGF